MNSCLVEAKKFLTTVKRLGVAVDYPGSRKTLSRNAAEVGRRPGEGESPLASACQTAPPHPNPLPRKAGGEGDLDATPNKRLHPRLGGVASLGVLLVTILLLTSVCGAEEPAAGEGSSEGEPRAALPTTFSLVVVGPRGDPVADAPVEFRAAVKADQIVRGKSVGVNLVQTDKEGRLTLKRSSPEETLGLTIKIPGYSPYSTEWNFRQRNETVPAEFRAQLGEAWSAGSVVVDEQGKPLAGADVVMYVEFKKRPGDKRHISSGTRLKTDAAGRWRFDHAPTTRSDLYVEVSHPKYSTVRRGLVRALYGITLDKQPTATLVLEPAVTVTGKVTDEQGKPIANASVRAQMMNDSRRAVSDDKGEYQIEGCDRGTIHLVASSPGKSIQIKRLNLGTEPARFDFKMEPGRKIRLRVEDMQGKPLPKARVHVRLADGQVFVEQLNQFANQEGVWEWNEAPTDEVKVDISPEGHMYKSSQPVKARAEEYVFRHSPQLEINVHVIDAETRKDVPEFSWTYGVLFAGNSDFYWMKNETKLAKGGKFTFKHSLWYETYGIRIEAPGYRPATSRTIRNDEGKLELNFELQKAADIVATVLAPNGRRAIGAEASLITGSNYVMIRNGVLERNENLEVQESDRVGHIRFPAQEKPFDLIVLHPSGYAQLSLKPQSVPTSIQLLPWGQVEGTYRRGKNPAAGIVISAFKGGERSSPQSRNIHWNFEATTDQQGHYVMDRLLSGTVRVGRMATFTTENELGQTMHYSNPFQLMPVEVVGGKTKTLDFTGGGILTGKLQAPADFKDNVPWKRVVIYCRTVATIGSSISAFLGSAQPSHSYSTNVQPDGTFRFEDVAAGTYQLSVHTIPGTQLWLEPTDKEVRPEAVADVTKPFDVGTLTLATRNAQRVPRTGPSEKARIKKAPVEKGPVEKGPVEKPEGKAAESKASR